MPILPKRSSHLLAFALASAGCLDNIGGITVEPTSHIESTGTDVIESTGEATQPTSTTAQPETSTDTSSTGTLPPCDDDPACGPDEDVEHCPEQCNVCGDSVVVPPETCDNGINDDPEYSPTPPAPDACPARCIAVEFCGDAIQNGPEPCDSGGAQTADCEADCRTPTCGDGTLNTFAGEFCDDGNLAPGDGCSPDCIEERRVFVTSVSFVGDLDNEAHLPNPDMLAGIPLADHHCNTLATAAGLPPTFKAWLSDDDLSPLSRFDTSFTGLYRLRGPDFPIVASGWTDLTDGTLAHPINASETGTLTHGNTHTNTNADGTSASDQHCSSWTASDNSFTTVGYTLSTESAWTNAIDGQFCSSIRHIYCFEDP